VHQLAADLGVERAGVARHLADGCEPLDRIVDVGAERSEELRDVIAREPRRGARRVDRRGDGRDERLFQLKSLSRRCAAQAACCDRQQDVVQGAAEGGFDALELLERQPNRGDGAARREPAVPRRLRPGHRRRRSVVEAAPGAQHAQQAGERSGQQTRKDAQLA
jgi:hypothetical protein